MLEVTEGFVCVFAARTCLEIVPGMEGVHLRSRGQAVRRLELRPLAAALEGLTRMNVGGAARVALA